MLTEIEVKDFLVLWKKVRPKTEELSKRQANNQIFSPVFHRVMRQTWHQIWGQVNEDWNGVD